MQGLAKPVNDLSRGATVPDIVNTVLMTSMQAMQAQVGKNKSNKNAGEDIDFASSDVKDV